MFQSVHDAFIRFTAQLEGATTWMYQDINGQVTTGYGNLIDTVEDAQVLKWYHKSGLEASPWEVSAQWHNVKAIKGKTNAPVNFWRDHSNINLAVDELNAFAYTVLLRFEQALKVLPEFRLYETWPADAQLGVLSMAWAMGPDKFKQFVKFRLALDSMDWVRAAAECKMDDTHNPGLVNRNKANYQLFMNAAAMDRLGSNVTVLQYPKTIVGATNLEKLLT